MTRLGRTLTIMQESGLDIVRDSLWQRWHVYLLATMPYMNSFSSTGLKVVNYLKESLMMILSWLNEPVPFSCVRYVKAYSSCICNASSIWTWRLLILRPWRLFIYLFIYCLAAGEYSMLDQDGKQNQVNRLWISSTLRPVQEVASTFRHTRVCGTWSRKLRTDWIWHRFVVGRYHLLRLVSSLSLFLSFSYLY